MKGNDMIFWDRHPCGGHYDQSVRERFNWYFNAEPWLKPEMKRIIYEHTNILEVGIGQGFLLIHNTKKFNSNFVGVDISQESLEMAKRNAKEIDVQVDLRLMDVKNLHFEDKSFDMVMSIGVIHHTDNVELALKEICRVTNDRFYVMIYSRNGPKSLFVRIVRNINSTIGRIIKDKNWMYKRISKNNKAAGTALLELFGVPHMKMYNKTMTRQLIKKTEKLLNSELKYKTWVVEPGFKRLFEVFNLKSLSRFGNWIDKKTYNYWGFYRIIEGHKCK